MISKPKRMKQRIITLLSLALCFGFTACAWGPKKAKTEKPICAEWLMPDSFVINKLGDRLTSVLFAPHSVKCYSLVGKEKVEEKNIEIEPNFVQENLLGKLRPNEIAVLQYTLLKQANSYENDSIKVMSPYIPAITFEFRRKDETANVVISLSDMTWTVVYDGKAQFNYNYANKELISQFCNYYINNNKMKQTKTK